MDKALIVIVLIISFFNLSLTPGGVKDENRLDEVLETGQTFSKHNQNGAQPESELSESSEPIVQMTPQYIPDTFCLFGSITDDGRRVLRTIIQNVEALTVEANQMNILDQGAIRMILQGLIDSSIFILSRIGDNSEQIAKHEKNFLSLIGGIKSVFNYIARTHVRKLDFIKSMKVLRESDIWGVVTYIVRFYILFKFNYYKCWRVSPNSELWLNIMNTDEKVDSIYRIVRYIFGNRVFVLFAKGLRECMRTSSECLNDVQQRLFDLCKDRSIIRKLGEPSSINNLIFLLSVLYDNTFKSVHHLILDLCSKIAANVIISFERNILGPNEISDIITSRLMSAKYSETSLNSLLESLIKFKRSSRRSAAT